LGLDNHHPVFVGRLSHLGTNPEVEPEIVVVWLVSASLELKILIAGVTYRAIKETSEISGVLVPITVF
jgi:hypothetical protein